MKKRYALLLLSITTNLQAQIYCTPAVIPYASSMPGITHFVLNTINRTSAPLESAGSGFVSTGMTTSLQMGNTYTVSITHTIDASICPDMNIRVWIDYNHDGQLDDAGETVISVNHHPAGTYTGTFTVPLTAMSGITRLRATVKMSNLGGHTLPTPCDDPADPFGYHGEIEDYSVNLDPPGTSGMQEINPLLTGLEVYPNPVNTTSVLHFNTSRSTVISIELMNESGEKVRTIPFGEFRAAGDYSFPLNEFSNLPGGIYLLRINAGEHGATKPVIIPGSN